MCGSYSETIERRVWIIYIITAISKRITYGMTVGRNPQNYWIHRETSSNKYSEPKNCWVITQGVYIRMTCNGRNILFHIESLRYQSPSKAFSQLNWSVELETIIYISDYLEKRFKNNTGREKKIFFYHKLYWVEKIINTITFPLIVDI